jgi:hypothetical protein
MEEPLGSFKDITMILRELMNSQIEGYSSIVFRDCMRVLFRAIVWAVVFFFAVFRLLVFDGRRLAADSRDPMRALFSNLTLTGRDCRPASSIATVSSSDRIDPLEISTIFRTASSGNTAPLEISRHSHAASVAEWSLARTSLLSNGTVGNPSVVPAASSMIDSVCI